MTKITDLKSHEFLSAVLWQDPPRIHQRLAPALVQVTGPPRSLYRSTPMLSMQTTFEVRSCQVAPLSTPCHVLIWPLGEGLC